MSDVKQMQIITFLADDDESRQTRITYPNIAGLNPYQRSLAYWRCVAAFYATSARVQPTARHIFYTNKARPREVAKRNIVNFIKDLGVEVRELPFRRFRPPASVCTRFLNIFYRHEVLYDVANSNTTLVSLIMDSDCVWLTDAATFLERFGDGKLHAFEVHQHCDPDFPVHLGLSKRMLGDAFRQLDPAYSTQEPAWYGGEFFGGTSSALKAFIDEFAEWYTRFVSDDSFANVSIGGIKLLDTDEFINSFVLTRGSFEVCNEPWLIHRVWTGPGAAHDGTRYLGRKVLHFPAEKHLGFRALYPFCTDFNSEFWTTPLAGFPDFLGGFFGIPQRTRFPAYSLWERTKASLKRFIKP